MKSSENSHGDVSEVMSELRAFGVKRFGSLKAFAGELGITPQNLNGYLSGERKPGRVFLTRLSEIGFDVSRALDTHPRVSEQSQDQAPLALDAAQMILGIPLEILSPQLEATPSQVKQWTAGKAYPSTRQLALLFNMVAIAGVAARCGGHAIPAPSPILPMAATA